MIAIVNVSPEDAPMEGVNKYELRVNADVICTFEHNRAFHNGLAQCLRDAAHAVETQRDREIVKRADHLLVQAN